jgi:hypothetical protein
MQSEAYLDIVGEVDYTGWPPSYAGVIDRPCKRCGAEPWQMCTNPATPWREHAAKAPCKIRFSLS